jgi:uncharacterized protein (TIGR02145 family)
MKKIFSVLLLTFFLAQTSIAQVGIGTNTPAASAQLDVTSTERGFLVPRMSSTERNAIVSPANGLQIYNTTTGCLNYFNINAWYEVCGTIINGIYPAGSVFCSAGPTAIVDVTNPTTGKTWMDRNLGATQVATSSTDAAAYGDLYQWGRGTDGHQCRTSAITYTVSTGDQPGNALFILQPNQTPYDWRNPGNNNLWQGQFGINNPCPTGYRIPTEIELNNERLSWSSYNSIGAFGSVLKWTKAGYREFGVGDILDAGNTGFYYSSNVSSSAGSSRYLVFGSTFTAYIGDGWREYGCSVRCIKN